MSWWEADPVAAPAVAPAQAAPTNAGGSWWESDPPADRAAPPPGPGVNTTIRPNAKQPEVAQAGSYGQNLGRQAMQGVTFGFADEIGAGLGALKALLTDDEYGDLYNKILERNRAQDKQFSEENPVASTAAQIGGALVTAPFTPALQAARGAGLGARAGAGLVTAGGYGALYGAGTGEGLEDRAGRAATGAAFGGAAGGALPVIGAGLRAAGGAIAAPFRGALGADKEAARRVGMALDADGVDVASAQRAMQMWRAEGVPIVAGDTGGEMTLAVARSAANTSPQARERLRSVTEDRWLRQGDRALRLVRSITGAGEDTEGLLLNLKQRAQAANAPAYQKAYSAANAQAVWTPELQQLSAAPTFQQAMRAAERIGRDDAALKGFPPIKQPFNFSPDGVVSLKPGAVPNLQFWDYVHRALQRAAETESKKSKTRAAQIGDLDRRLKGHLDIVVPEFGKARAGAAAFFGAEDAGEAGRMLVTAKMENAAVKRAFGDFNKAERDFARETFANELLRQIRSQRDRVNVTNTIFENPQMRDRIEIVLGDTVAERMEALVRVENIMNNLKQAVSGNSTTVRQLAEAGLAGGGAGAWYGSGDPTSITYGALLGSALRFGGQRIDARVARRVGEMLASDDPQVLDQASRMVARNARLINAVRNVEERLARSLAPAHPDMALRNVIGGATDESNQPRDNLGR